MSLTDMRLTLLLAVLILAGCSANSPDRTRSFVLHEAVIYTVDPAKPIVEAMAVVDGKVQMTGTTEEVTAEWPDLALVSAGGRAVVPGFIDAHAHLMNLGREKLYVNLRDTGSIGEVIERLKAFEADLPEGAWLQGRGWNQVLWPGGAFPSREDLDAHFPDRPVWLTRVDGHAAWANSAAIRAAGEDMIAVATDPDGGAIQRDANGRPTGIFIDNAMDLVESAAPELTAEELDRALELALEETAAVGLTGVHDAGVDTMDINRYKRFIDEGRFPLRLYGMVSGQGPAFDVYCNNHLLDYGDRLTIRSVKFYLDGALGSRGAALIEDYSDDPGNRGLLRMDVDAFNEAVKEALDCGYQVNTHAIGDHGNRILLDGYEAAGISPEGRHRDEHTQIVAVEDIPRFKELGVIASFQPTHATSDKNMAEDRVGPHRIKGGYAWRTFLDQGSPIAFGSDFPVERSNPLLGFFAAITRQGEDMQPEGGWYPEQRLTREATLHAFTLGAAWAGFQEDVLGSLEPGKHADFVVLSSDIMSIPAPRILETSVVATYVGGTPVYGSL